MPPFKHTQVFLWILFAYVLVSRFYAATFDAAPALWDEQFHMVVAKNLTEDPTVPYLVRDHVLDYHPFGWGESHVWMHKPPLFTYIMAGSMKFFGPTVLAGRLPSILFSALMVFIVFGIGRELGSRRIGLIAAMLWAGFSFDIKLIRGLVPTDHNDLHFIFWVALSLFLFFRYQNRKTIKNALWLGVVVAMAVLTKWLVGLLIFLPWGVMWLKELFAEKKLPSETKYFFTALLTVIVLVLPWHLYMYTNFTDLYNHEMEYNRRHLFEAIEGHDKPWYFHFDVMDIIYGTVFTISAVPGFFLLKRFITPKYYWQILLMMGFVYLFFSLAVTKMISFTVILSPLWFLLAGATFIWLFDVLAKWKWTLVFWFAILATVINTMHRPTNVLVNKEWNDAIYVRRQHHAEIFKDWEEKHNTEKWVLVNYSPFHKSQFLFFTKGVAYSKTATDEEVEKLKNEGYTLIVYDRDNDVFEFLN